jgi:23S rRNA G2445 N2-methylase RlmL
MLQLPHPYRGGYSVDNGDSPAMRLFALATRGLEKIAAAELIALPRTALDDIGYRRVAVRSDAPAEALVSLRTVDDLFIDAATWQVEHTRAALPVMTAAARALDLGPAVAACAKARPLVKAVTFSVTPSFVGKRNYSTDEIRDAVARGIGESTRLQFSEQDDDADFNVRVFIEHERAFVGVRLAKRPLHERAWKIAHIPGSLKPSTAAAMLALAGVQPGMRVFDPCCGAGTIVIEAALSRAHARGCDLDQTAVDAAMRNAAAAKADVTITRSDARALPAADASIDRIVTNLPWGLQVKVDDHLREFYRKCCVEMRRALAPGGRIAALTTSPELLQFPGLARESITEISLFGQTPSIAVFS